jgi:hypothetical protein
MVANSRTNKVICGKCGKPISGGRFLSDVFICDKLKTVASF